VFAEWLQLSDVGGVLPALLANCRHVEALLTQLGRYHGLFGFGPSRLSIDLTNSGAEVRLTRDDGTPMDIDSVDACFAMLLRNLRRLAGLRRAQAQVELRRSAPSNWTAYDARFQVRFGAEADRCLIDRSALRNPIVTADPALFDVLRPCAENQLSQLHGRWSQLVATAVLAELEDDPGLPEVSQRLALSSRSLQLYLQNEGTSFSQIVDDVRRNQVMSMLAVTSIPLMAIADSVGLAGQASLTRAVRRWAGQTPKQLRQQAWSGRAPGS